MKQPLSKELALIQKAQTEPVTFTPLYDQYFGRVYNFVRYRVGDASLADDITAQIFEKAFTRIASYNPDTAPFGAWLFTIARNTVNDYWRKEKRRRWLSLDMVRGRASAAPTPAEFAQRNAEKEALLVAVGTLKAREQEIISLKFAGGFTNREIAGILQLTESNVGVILYRALKKLKKLLSDEVA